MVPIWVAEGTFDEDWPDAPQRGDMVQLVVKFTEDLETGDGEEWSSALMRGRASVTDERSVSALVTATSKLPPKRLAGMWDVTLEREADEQPWKLVKMTRRHG
ncbi:MAG: hypothetical protein IPJ65_02260 [Archangiaceae bacterium]|nr:hypothetical protein [Archangiaceae bacterium]